MGKGFHNPKFRKGFSKNDDQRKAMFANMNMNQPKSSQRKKKGARPRPRINFNNPTDEIKFVRQFDNNVTTVSNSSSVRVVGSSDDKYERRNYQTNAIDVELEDHNLGISIIDQQNSLKPKREKLIVSELDKDTGVVQIREFGEDNKQVANLQLIPRELSPIPESDPTNIDTFKQENTKLGKKEIQFNIDLATLTNPELKDKYNVTFLREIALQKHPEGLKRPENIKDERIWLLRYKIRK